MPSYSYDSTRAIVAAASAAGFNFDVRDLGSLRFKNVVSFGDECSENSDDECDENELELLWCEKCIFSLYERLGSDRKHYHCGNYDKLYDLAHKYGFPKFRLFMKNLFGDSITALFVSPSEQKKRTDNAGLNWDESLRYIMEGRVFEIKDLRYFKYFVNWIDNCGDYSNLFHQLTRFGMRLPKFIPGDVSITQEDINKVLTVSHMKAFLEPLRSDEKFDVTVIHETTVSRVQIVFGKTVGDVIRELNLSGYTFCEPSGYRLLSYETRMFKRFYTGEQFRTRVCDSTYFDCPEDAIKSPNCRAGNMNIGNGGARNAAPL